MKKKSFFTFALLIFSLVLFSDFQAQTVAIGTQVWSTKNLDVSTFRNGDTIYQAITEETWQAAVDNQLPAWCYYDNDSTNGTKYGKLYNWYAVNDPRGLAPEGYHIPTNAEFTKVADFFGGDVQLLNMKMKSTSGWSSYTKVVSKACSNCLNWSSEKRKKVHCQKCKDTRSVILSTDTQSGDGTNSSGFAGLPGGFRGNWGAYKGIGMYGLWWTSTNYSSLYGIFRYLSYNNADLSIEVQLNLGLNSFKSEGMSVRCIKD